MFTSHVKQFSNSIFLIYYNRKNTNHKKIKYERLQNRWVMNYSSILCSLFEKKKKRIAIFSRQEELLHMAKVISILETCP